MNNDKKSYAGGGAAIAFLAFLFGCILGAVIFAPMLARMVAR